MGAWDQGDSTIGSQSYSRQPGPNRPSALADNTLLDLHNSSDHTQLYPIIIIANYGDSCLFYFDYFKFSSSFARFSANSGYKLRQV